MLATAMSDSSPTAVVGIDLGGTTIKAALVSPSYQLLGRSAVPTELRSQTSLLDAIERLVAHVSQDTAPAAVGFGLPSQIDQRHGRVLDSTNVPLEEIDFKDEMARRLGVRVEIDNDANAACLAEVRIGAARGARHVVMLTLGTGVGGGLVLDGKPWLGRGSAGEIGHVVVQLGGARCTCGRRGCMEAYAGRAAMEAHARKEVAKGKRTDLFRLMEERDRTRLTSGIWSRALEHEDELAVRLIDRAIAALGAGVASVVNVLDVECVILGGGLGVRFGEEYAGRLAAAMQPHLFADFRPPDVHVAALGDFGGAVGATLLVEPAQAPASAAAA
jgi:glucokinase